VFHPLGPGLRSKNKDATQITSGLRYMEEGKIITAGIDDFTLFNTCTCSQNFLVSFAAVDGDS